MSKQYKTRGSTSSNFEESIKCKYQQKKYNWIPKKESVRYYMSVMVTNKPRNLEIPEYISISSLDSNEPAFIENSHERRTVDTVIDLNYTCYATFNILVKICYKSKFNENSPYFYVPLLVYVFHTVIKKNISRLPEIFLDYFNDIRDYLIDCCYGCVERNFVIYRPIEIAAFYGNLEAFKHLIVNGATYNRNNALNESIYDIIDAGLLRSNNSSDDIESFFNKEKFSSCLDFLKLMEKNTSHD